MKGNTNIHVNTTMYPVDEYADADNAGGAHHGDSRGDGCANAAVAATTTTTPTATSGAATTVLIAGQAQLSMSLEKMREARQLQTLRVRVLVPPINLRQRVFVAVYFERCLGRHAISTTEVLWMAREGIFA